MFLPQIPLNKVGTPFQLPSWRYTALHNPKRFGLTPYCSKREEVNSGFLRRMISRGVQPSTVYTYPGWFNRLRAELNPKEAGVLERVWNKEYFGRHKRKLTFNSANSALPVLSWNLTLAEKLNDVTLKKLVYHTFGDQHDPAISKALKWYLDTGNSEMIRHVHYACYYGMSDVEMAKMWVQPVSVIRMLRLLFFDYNSAPTDRLAKFSYIRQLVANGEIDEIDHQRFRRIFDLGKLGLDSLLGSKNLSSEDHKQLENFLAASVMDNTVNLQYTIASRKDAMDVNRAMVSMAEVKSVNETNRLRDAVLNLQLQRQQKEDSAEVTNFDDSLMETVRNHVDQYALIDTEPKFPSFVDLKQTEESK